MFVHCWNENLLLSKYIYLHISRKFSDTMYACIFIYTSCVWHVWGNDIYGLLYRAVSHLYEMEKCTTTTLPSHKASVELQVVVFLAYFNSMMKSILFTYLSKMIIHTKHKHDKHDLKKKKNRLLFLWQRNNLLHRMPHVSPFLWESCWQCVWSES